MAQAARNFNPRSPRGGATSLPLTSFPGFGNFNPRSPRGGATLPFKKLYIITPPYFNPRSPRGGATYGLWATPHGTAFQSTLPTRGSDFGSCHLFFLRENFNPRSPRGGATVYTQADGWLCPNFNPRSPRGGATCAPMAKRNFRGISIHAPHEGERQSREIHG